MIVYPMTTGRNFDELLRVLDSLQLTAKYNVATRVNWKYGENVIIEGSVSNEEAAKMYPKVGTPRDRISELCRNRQRDNLALRVESEATSRSEGWLLASLLPSDIFE
jgi:hypothetical protein